MTVLFFQLWVPTFSLAENSTPVVPYQFPFDVSKKNSSLDETFSVKEYRNYIFSIQFEYISLLQHVKLVPFQGSFHH